MKRLYGFMALLFLPSVLYAAQEHPMFRHSGLPIPRFVSLKSETVNVRVGPGKRYPIEWIYKRKGWPVEVVEEYGHWRKIRDIENAEGWVHKNLLSGTRTALIQDQRRPLYLAPDASTAIVLEADPLVVGTLISCNKEWCRMSIQSREGWMRRDYIWGVYDSEVINEK